MGKTRNFDYDQLFYDDYVYVGAKHYSIGYLEAKVHFYKLLFNHNYLVDFFLYKSDDFESFFEISIRDVPFNIDLNDVALDEDKHYVDVLGNKVRELYNIHSEPFWKIYCIDDDLTPIEGTERKNLYQIVLKRFIPY